MVTVNKKTLHMIWNNLKGKQIELFWNNASNVYTVRTYVVKESGKSRFYDLDVFKDFTQFEDAEKYAKRITKAKCWKQLSK